MSNPLPVVPGALFRCEPLATSLTRARCADRYAIANGKWKAGEVQGAAGIRDSACRGCELGAEHLAAEKREPSPPLSTFAAEEVPMPKELKIRSASEAVGTISGVGPVDLRVASTTAATIGYGNKDAPCPSCGATTIGCGCDTGAIATAWTPAPPADDRDALEPDLAATPDDTVPPEEPEPRGPASRTVTIALNPQQWALLSNLVDAGLFGDSSESAAHFLVIEGLGKHFPKAFASFGLKP